jgi:hypothetical protein
VARKKSYLEVRNDKFRDTVKLLVSKGLTKDEIEKTCVHIMNVFKAGDGIGWTPALEIIDQELQKASESADN